MSEKCTKCGKEMTNKPIQLMGYSGLLQITYCPKCEYVKSSIQPISVFVGKSLRGIDKKTGDFRMKIVKPENSARKEMVVKTFPNIIVTKKSEFRVRGKQITTTQERTAKVYPNLKSGDEIIVAGFDVEGFPFISIFMKNNTLGLSTTFIPDEIKLKKGFLSSFKIENPVLIETRKIINGFMI